MDTDTSSRRLTVIGLGPCRWRSLTLDAADLLRSGAVVHVRRNILPLLDDLRSHSGAAFVPIGGAETDDDAVMVDRLIELAGRDASTVFAVAGNPITDEPGLVPLAARLQKLGVALRLVPGMPAASPTAEGKPVDASWVQSMDAHEAAEFGAADAVGQRAGGGAPVPWRAPTPTAALAIVNLDTEGLALDVQRWLCRYYPSQHPVHVVSRDGDVHDAELSQLPSAAGGGVSVLLPPVSDVDNVRTFAGLLQLTRRLRAPGGCPWDREQTHASLKPHLLEETYEVLEALDANDPEQMVEEFGDLLFQVTIHSQVAAEAGEFTIEDVIEHVTRKLTGRHPHVFGDMELGDAQAVRLAWESFKQKEKPKRASVLEQIPRGLPALPQSNLIQKRAASVGFEWPELRQVLAKVREELAELEQALDEGASRDEQREEFGDILFALVSVARHMKLDPEESLRLANRKFGARFQYVESRVSGAGKTLKDLSPEELDVYWNEAKALGTAWHPDEEVETQNSAS